MSDNQLLKMEEKNRRDMQREANIQTQLLTQQGKEIN